MAKNKLVSPFVKWVGGKRQLMTEITQELPGDISKLKYYEPFVGGGAVLFNLQPRVAFINDANDELVNAYNAIKNDVDLLIESLGRHKNDADYFYAIRAQDREPLFNKSTSIERASRFIYLNKTCYNGLYRVNNTGEFNSPYGYYQSPNIINEPVLRAVSKYLNENKISITSGDYAKCIEGVRKDSFVYLDPPYHPVSSSASFTGYIAGGWDEDDQCRLKALCDDLNSKGVRFMVSNSNTSFIRSLYKDYHIKIVKASRAINSVGAKRGDVEEVFVKNYE